VPITDCMLTYVQEPLEMSRRGCARRHLNGKYVSSLLRKLVACENDVSEGVPATVIS